MKTLLYIQFDSNGKYSATNVALKYFKLYNNDLAITYQIAFMIQTTDRRIERQVNG